MDNEKQGIETLRSLLAFKGQYHNHKETMAHAAVAVQIAILVSMIGMDSLPISCFGLNRYWLHMQKLLNSVAYSFIWGVISCYICWQFKNRRIAREQVDNLIKALGDNCKKSEIHSLIHQMRDVSKTKGWFKKNLAGY